MIGRCLGKVGVGTGIAFALLAAPRTAAEHPPGERPALGPNRLLQHQIADGTLSLAQVRRAGLRIFTLSFNKLDGFGDGPMDLNDTLSPGGRPTLQGNGTFLRVNGLDSQSCGECHSLISAATVPPRLGVGGAGGSVANAMIRPTAIDADDSEDLDGAAGFDGRFANPPFVFGSGGVELLAIEMTEDLQRRRRRALANPGQVVSLVTKGVSFGSIVADGLGNLDTSQVEGVDRDLVVRPFGRKGQFTTGRAFTLQAMPFHFGIQPVEIVGEDVDADGDGFFNELLAGEVSALHAFMASLARPVGGPLGEEARRGRELFGRIGCATCHVPELTTRGRELPLRLPEDPLDPEANVYLRLDLSRRPAGFERAGGGLRVPLYADLKRHDMGPALAEGAGESGRRGNRTFTTARLWGVADTAPYLHDGRATTLTEAILLHGGEAEAARDGFAALADASKADLLEFLRSLRTPRRPLRGSAARVSTSP